MSTYHIGQKVKYSAAMLRAGASKRWRGFVIDHDGPFIILDEPSSVQWDENQLERNPSLAYRRIAPAGIVSG